MAGNLLQIGNANGLLRVKSDGIIVAGALDACCCVTASRYYNVQGCRVDGSCLSIVSGDYYVPIGLLPNGTYTLEIGGLYGTVNICTSGFGCSGVTTLPPGAIVLSPVTVVTACPSHFCCECGPNQPPGDVSLTISDITPCANCTEITLSTSPLVKRWVRLPASVGGTITLSRDAPCFWLGTIPLATPIRVWNNSADCASDNSATVLAEVSEVTVGLLRTGRTTWQITVNVSINDTPDFSLVFFTGTVTTDDLDCLSEFTMAAVARTCWADIGGLSFVAGTGGEIDFTPL